MESQECNKNKVYHILLHFELINKIFDLIPNLSNQQTEER